MLKGVVIGLLISLLITGGLYWYFTLHKADDHSWPINVSNNLTKRVYENCLIANGLTEASPDRCYPYAECYVWRLSQKLHFKEYAELEVTSNLGQPLKADWIRMMAESVDACKNADFHD